MSYEDLEGSMASEMCVRQVWVELMWLLVMTQCEVAAPNVLA